jgi:hypothetical protein
MKVWGPRRSRKVSSGTASMSMNTYHWYRSQKLSFREAHCLNGEEKQQEKRDRSKENHESPGVSRRHAWNRKKAHRVLIVKEIAFLFLKLIKVKGSNNLGYALVEEFLDKTFLLATVARSAATTKRVFVHWYGLW